MADNTVMQSGRYKAYPEYKDSGVELLGRMPSNWQVLRYKNILKVMQGMAFKSSEYVDKSNVVNIRMGNIKKGGYIDLKHNTKYLPEKYKDFYSEYELHEGDAVIAMTDMSPSLDFLAVPAVLEGLDANTVYLLNQRVGKIILDEEFDIRFIRYWLLSDELRGQLKAKGLGTVQANMSNEDLYGSYFLCPSKNERVKIVDFLDYETAKIDTLIQKQKRLIELLTEKRQAVISHAVTKGLNPDVPMKDSGVEWLGEVPGHWEVGYLGYYATLETGATPSRANLKYWNGNIPWVKTGEIRYDTIYETEEKVTDLAIKQTSIRLSPAGTLLMAMYGQGITRGRVALLGVPATYNQACVAITVNDEVFNEYMKWYFIAGYKALRDGGNETSQMNLNADIVRKFKVLVPSIYEQKSIVDYLINKLPTFDNLLNKANQQIQLMQERRTALISAAVTGKIDVRDWDVHVASEVCS